MTVRSYQKDGKRLWRVTIDMRSPDIPTARIQGKQSGFKSEREALAAEKRLLKDAARKLAVRESKGSTWGEVIRRWELYHRQNPSDRYVLTTIVDHSAMLQRWTSPWLKIVASELTRGDGREVLRFAEGEGKNTAFIKRLKNTINVIYTWGIEERLITGVHQSPVHGLSIKKQTEEKVPEILTLEQIRTLLRKAKEQDHEWYSIWVTAVLTGCRSGELFSLKKSDFEIISRKAAIAEDQKPADQRNYGILRVRRSWNTRFKQFTSTKAGYWRNVPISKDFYWFLLGELKFETLKSEDFLLPRIIYWRRGEQAKVLRCFCQEIGLPSIRFHALRACFATQLISAGVPAATVMKICGWRDLSTMQRYIRLAGIDEAGATEALDLIPQLCNSRTAPIPIGQHVALHHRQN